MLFGSNDLNVLGPIIKDMWLCVLATLLRGVLLSQVAGHGGHV